MEVAEKRYKLEDLPGLMGKVVRTVELSQIYDMWMILIRPQNSDMEDGAGILSFVGKETNKDSYALYNGENIIIPIYNNSDELNGDIYYEE